MNGMPHHSHGLNGNLLKRTPFPEHSTYFFQGIGLIHDSRHVGFQIVMQISHVLSWLANIGKKANCGKSARRNIEITLLKVPFIIILYLLIAVDILTF